MGSIDIIKPLSTVLISAINKSRQYKAKNSWECREWNLGLLGEKQVWYLCAMQHVILMRALEVLGLVENVQKGHLLSAY